MKKSKLIDAHTLPFTDGPYETDPEEKFKNYVKAGIGIFISSNLEQFHFYQAMGSQSIFCAKVGAIAVIKQLIKKMVLSKCMDLKQQKEWNKLLKQLLTFHEFKLEMNLILNSKINSKCFT